MPSHVHGILQLWTDERLPVTSGFDASDRHGVSSGSISAIVSSFRAASTKGISVLRDTPGASVWQRNYHDHIIRGEEELYRIREYIANNPANWRHDSENPERDVSAEYMRAWSWVEMPQGAAVLRPYDGAASDKLDISG
jgi:hypothetical protein